VDDIIIFESSTQKAGNYCVVPLIYETYERGEKTTKLIPKWRPNFTLWIYSKIL